MSQQQQQTAARPRNAGLTAALELVDASREADRIERERQARRLDAIEQELSTVHSLHKRVSELERRVARVDQIDAGVFDPASLGTGTDADRRVGGVRPRGHN